MGKVKTAMEDWLDMMAKCPKYCAPGTVMYTSDGVQDDDGVCLNADTLDHAKMELGKITKDTCMGTNCKIKADFPTQGKTLCARATAATAGFYAAVHEARKENIAHPPCGKCYGECTGAKGVADAKACKYEFYAKGMFEAKKCTCADDHVAGFHQEELIQGPKSIKHAKDMAAEKKEAAKAAAAEEEKQTKLEAQETAKAKQMGGAEAAEKKKYEDDLHKEEKEAQDEAENAAAKGAAAEAATAKAEAASKEFGADKKYIAEANAKAAATKKAAAAADAKEKKAEAAHDKELGAIEGKFGKTMKVLKKKKAAAEAKFSGEQAKITATFNKATKGNNAAYAAKKKELKKEAANIKKEAKAEQATIKAAYAKKVAAHNKVEADYQKEVATKKAVTEASRKKVQAAAASKAKSEEEQKEADSAAAKHQAEDAAMAECPEDSCADAQQKCHKVDNKHTFFSCSGPTDGWGCADHACKKDPFDIEEEYLGKKAQPVYPKPPKPSAACKAAHGVFANAAAAAGAKKQDNMYTSDGVQDDDGVCLNADTLDHAKMELGKITKD